MSPAAAGSTVFPFYFYNNGIPLGFSLGKYNHEIYFINFGNGLL
jgi:hypothetical protein